jgi:beta-lactamase superfamily II metal-dependent hydrolase
VTTKNLSGRDDLFKRADWSHRTLTRVRPIYLHRRSPSRCYTRTEAKLSKQLSANLLIPPAGGAVVRMYRVGHGDCFLLGLSGSERPVYVLIDFGYKPGSSLGARPDEIAADIKHATGGRIDVVVLTHEHQDHLNGITESRFEGLEIGQAWFAWTESASDELAIRLRKKHGDLLKLALAAHPELLAADPRAGQSLAELIRMEVGGEDTHAALGVDLPAKPPWTNKDAMRLVREASCEPPLYIYPHREIIKLSGSADVRVYALGPPYDSAAINDLNPKAGETFSSSTAGFDPPLASFAAAILERETGGRSSQPFSPRHSLRLSELHEDPVLESWYQRHYGVDDDAATDEDVIAENAAFRRIGGDWLQSAENVGLAMANSTNNSSVVLAFELGRGGKVLLFAGDAQRGSWASWASGQFDEDGEEHTVQDLLSRVVLYKVAHHGSHNATLNGTSNDPHPNLSWLGRGKFADEFTAMITAVRAWATRPEVGWDHPYPAIKSALLKKARGRVLQTDAELDEVLTTMAAHYADEPAVDLFKRRVTACDMYFDYIVDA